MANGEMSRRRANADGIQAMSSELKDLHFPEVVLGNNDRSELTS